MAVGVGVLLIHAHTSAHLSFWSQNCWKIFVELSVDYFHRIATVKCHNFFLYITHWNRISSFEVLLTVRNQPAFGAIQFPFSRNRPHLKKYSEINGIVSFLLDSCDQIVKFWWNSYSETFGLALTRKQKFFDPGWDFEILQKWAAYWSVQLKSNRQKFPSKVLTVTW